MYRPGAFSRNREPDSPGTESRVDPADGNPYSQAEFELCYGRTTEWHTAGLTGGFRDWARSRALLLPPAGSGSDQPSLGGLLSAYADETISATEFGEAVGQLFGPDTSELLRRLSEEPVTPLHDSTEALLPPTKQPAEVMQELNDLVGEETVRSFRMNAVRAYMQAPDKDSQAAAAQFNREFRQTFGDAYGAIYEHLVGILQSQHKDKAAVLRAMGASAALSEAVMTAASHEILEQDLLTETSLEHSLFQALHPWASARYVPDVESGSPSRLSADIDTVTAASLHKIFSDTAAAQGFSWACLRGQLTAAVRVLQTLGPPYFALGSCLDEKAASARKEASRRLMEALEARSGKDRLAAFRQVYVKRYMQADASDEVGLQEEAKVFCSNLAAVIGGKQNATEELIEDMCMLLDNGEKELALRIAWGALEIAPEQPSASALLQQLKEELTQFVSPKGISSFVDELEEYRLLDSSRPSTADAALSFYRVLEAAVEDEETVDRIVPLTYRLLDMQGGSENAAALKLAYEGVRARERRAATEAENAKRREKAHAEEQRREQADREALLERKLRQLVEVEMDRRSQQDRSEEKAFCSISDEAAHQVKRIEKERKHREAKQREQEAREKKEKERREREEVEQERRKKDEVERERKRKEQEEKEAERKRKAQEVREQQRRELEEREKEEKQRKEKEAEEQRVEAAKRREEDAKAAELEQKLAAEKSARQQRKDEAKTRRIEEEKRKVEDKKAHMTRVTRDENPWGDVASNGNSSSKPEDIKQAWPSVATCFWEISPRCAGCGGRLGLPNACTGSCV
ncbi:Reticulocyte-binding protein 2-like protein a [Diplonema papillatum]|nr:Reticulocyte-binding protein 2-like protein a [Diplonema papillatum]